MRKILLLGALITLGSCAELNSVANQLPEIVAALPQTTPALSQLDISKGLKEALNKGVEKQVVKLTSLDGFYKNEAVKILLPAELQQVDSKLRQIGLGKLADEGMKLMNRAAEDAVKEATPIFVNAITTMSISDARNILLGNNDAATNYLKSTTSKALYGKFSPVIKKSMDKVGASKVWTKMITNYNNIPFITKVNPDLTDYTTNKAMEGVFKMIAVEEVNIRTDLNSRTTDVLKKVFALQDKK